MGLYRREVDLVGLRAGIVGDLRARARLLLEDDADGE
jgi:hypothetical protein